MRQTLKRFVLLLIGFALVLTFAMTIPSIETSKGREIPDLPINNSAMFTTMVVEAENRIYPN